MCDGSFDCQDKTDEHNYVCSEFYSLMYDYFFYKVLVLANCSQLHNRPFQCDSTKCIHSHKICDGATDCADKKDEEITICGH